MNSVRNVRFGVVSVLSPTDPTKCRWKINPKEIILPTGNYRLIICYPIKMDVDIHFRVCTRKGMSAEAFMTMVSYRYREIYKVDEETEGQLYGIPTHSFRFKLENLHVYGISIDSDNLIILSM